MNSATSLSSQSIGRQFDGGLGTQRPGKVLIATSGASQCASVSVFLARRGHAFVIAETQDDALAHLKSSCIDLVVTAMPGPDADADLMRLVRQVTPGLPVIFLALGAGELDGAHLDCATGLTRAVAGDAPEAQSRLASLTTRERQVLNLIVGGRANKVIAYELSISPRTVENHRARVMEKLRVKSVAELVRLALHAGDPECGQPAKFSHSHDTGDHRATSA
jgi:DNA-binding NarL/FixJ family response regulator